MSSEIKFSLEKLDSQEFNSINNALYIRLRDVFDSLESIDNKASNHAVINTSTIKNLHTSIDKITAKLDAVDDMLSSKDSVISIIESFKNSESMEDNIEFYKERYGEGITKDSLALFDSSEEALTLPCYKSNAIIGNNGNIFADIKISRQFGKSIYNINSDNDLSNMIDTSKTTAWHETIFSDSPIKIELDKKDYDINYGAFCEFEINFKSKTSINEITLDTFTKYPIEILGIKYKETDVEEEPLKEIVSKNSRFEHLKDKVTDKEVSYKFENILCKKLYIGFRQIHHTSLTYNLNSEKMLKNKLWYNLMDSTDELDEHKALKPYFEDSFKENKLFKIFKASNIKEFTSSIFDSLFKKNSNKLITKYQYDYGFTNISAYLNDFEKTGIYISKPISVFSNINSISINSEEIHPKDTIGKINTDIEYYINLSSGNSVDSWISICPSNKEIVECELLQKANNKYKLRLKAKEVLNVYLNGKSLTHKVDYFLVYDENKTIEYIDIPNSLPFGTYTARYIPSETSKKIEIKNNGFESFKTEEIIQCNGSSYYKLSNVPLVKEASNIMINIINTDTGEVFTEDNGYIINVTNTADQNESYKNFKKGNLIQYYVDKNCIYLNQEFQSPYMITASYSNLVSSFRLKAILRRTNSMQHLTPVLHKIAYKIFTME